MFAVTLGPYTIRCLPDRLPDRSEEDSRHAALVEEFDLDDPEMSRCFLSVSRGTEWPFLVVAQGYRPAGGFHPGALLVPEADLLFIGAGERLLAYDLTGPKRLWIDVTYPGFRGWARHGDRVILSAELELAAWDLRGQKCWSVFVEPPWGYEVSGGMIDLDVMGRRSRFPIREGPATRGSEFG